MILVTAMTPDLGMGEGAMEDVEVCDDDAEEVVDVVVDALNKLDLLDELPGEGVGAVEGV